MAWPCITRACCINRFWSELDKGDIAVPLVFTRYSDVAADVQQQQQQQLQHLAPHRYHHHPQPKQLHRAAAGAVAIETLQPHHAGEEEAAKAPPPAAGAAAGGGGDGSNASVMRQDFRAWKVVRPEPSCKPKNDYYQRSEAPFGTETQYQKDYKPWPIPKKGDHPWIPKPGAPGETTEASEAETGVEKSEMEEKVHEKEESKEVTTKKAAKKEKSAERKTSDTVLKEQEQVPADVERKGRAAADAVNKQIKEIVSTGSSYRNEFKAYKDVKPVKLMKAPSQYKPPVEETSRETSYSATYKGEQAKALSGDNKLLERRRIRSLYSEPSKEATKVDKPASRSKPKKMPTTTTGKMVKKAKERQIASSQSAKKKPPSSTPEPKPEGVTKKSKEISNRLAEAKQ